MAAPEQGPALAVALCHEFKFNSDCDTMYGILGIGPIITQVVANADVGGFDGQVCPTAASRRFTSAITLECYFLDALRELPWSLPFAACLSSEPYWLVRQAQTQPASDAEEAQWPETQGFASF